MLPQATEFVKDYDKRTALVKSQIRTLSSCTDDDQKKMLEYWISNNRRWLLEREQKYTICKEIINVSRED